MSKGKDIADPGPDLEFGSRSPIEHHHHHHRAESGSTTPVLSRYESQKRRDWNTFSQYLKNQRPPVAGAAPAHVLDFLRYLDQFGKTKVHVQGCMFFGQPDPPGPCTCPLRQAWGSLDALIGRLRAAYEENGFPPETNPFASGAIRMYLREVRDSQAKARGVPYKKKKKKKKRSQLKAVTVAASNSISNHNNNANTTSDDGCSRFNPMQ